MNRRDKAQAPRPGMIWSERHGMWVDPDRRTEAQRAREEKLAGEVEADHKKVEEALRAAESARGKRAAQVQKTADQAALRLLRSLIEARKKAKLSQAEVARRMQVPQPAVVRLESGTHSPTLTTLSRYAAAIGVKLEVRRIA